MSLFQSTGAAGDRSGFAALGVHQAEAALAGRVARAPTLVASVPARRFPRSGPPAGAEKG